MGMVSSLPSFLSVINSIPYAWKGEVARKSKGEEEKMGGCVEKQCFSRA